jgi:uncharacterized protein YecT (DUF1311 family)
MNHEAPRLNILRRLRAWLGLAIGLALSAVSPMSGSAAGQGDGAAAKPRSDCDSAPTAIDRLISAEPSLAVIEAALDAAFRDYRDRAARPTERDARLVEQRLWLEVRARACPAATPNALPAGARRESAVACLSRIYQQRVAVLRYERNAAAWPRVRFRPALVKGAGTKLCEELQRDLVASFFGRGLFVNPLGEREVGFMPMPGLDDDPMVLRADIDAYNLGKPFPILQWIEDNGGLQLSTVEYRAFASPLELLGAIGRGVEPLAKSVRTAAHAVIDVDRLPRPDPKKPITQPRAAFARGSILTVDEMPRFFRHQDRIYLLSPMKPASDKPGDLGVYRLYGPAQLHRACLFDAHMPIARSSDRALALPEVEEFGRAAGPLLPTGRLCAGLSDTARTLAEHAAWRPWVLDRRRPAPGDLSGEQIALYMRNRALTGPEKARQYRAYVSARDAAIAALTPFYRNEFGRTAAEAQRFAALYLDRKISDGFETDPDDPSTLMLLAADYAGKHDVQQAALAGDTLALRNLLGPEPKAIAKGVTRELDEPLLADAIEHPVTLRALLELGLDPNEIGASGRTPLMTAARLDLVEAAAILLAHGAAPDTGAGDAVAQTDSTGDPLCMKGDVALSDAPGRTALSYAAELGSPEMIRLLLDRGASATRPDSTDRRPADYVKDRRGQATQAAKIVEMLK